jgi:hypothetical protein
MVKEATLFPKAKAASITITNVHNKIEIANKI